MPVFRFPNLLRPFDDEALRRDRGIALEIWLVLLSIVLSGFMAWIPIAREALLTLFFLPVSVMALYVGRHRAGYLALLSVVLATLVLYREATPLQWLGVATWGSVLAMQALVIGSLSDERRRELQHMEEMHRADTLSDALTGVANRRAFDYEINRRMAEWHRQRSALSLMLLDIDHFKRLNDSYGHQAGDLVLHNVAQLVAMHCRETDLVARYGGEEFAIIMPNTPSSEAKKVAERVREGIEEAEFDIGGLVISATISIGLAQVLRSEDREEFVKRADVALYASKQAGRNCCHFHEGRRTEIFGASPQRANATETNPPSVELSQACDRYTDQTTGLPTRKVFVEELRRRLSENRRYAGDISVMLVQVDELGAKGVTDKSLRQKINALVAECLRQVLRDVDLVACLDEDQFGVLMPRTNITDALIPAERLRQRVAQSRNLSTAEGLPEATISVGLAAPTRHENPSALVQRAQQAVWNAVREGGNRVGLHLGTEIELVPILNVDEDLVTSSGSGNAVS